VQIYRLALLTVTELTVINKCVVAIVVDGKRTVTDTEYTASLVTGGDLPTYNNISITSARLTVQHYEQR